VGKVGVSVGLTTEGGMLVGMSVSDGVGARIWKGITVAVVVGRDAEVALSVEIGAQAEPRSKVTIIRANVTNQAKDTTSRVVDDIKAVFWK